MLSRRFSLRLTGLVMVWIALTAIACSGGSSSEPQASPSSSPTASPASPTSDAPDPTATTQLPPSVVPGGAIFPTPSPARGSVAPADGISAVDIILKGDLAGDAVGSYHSTIEITVSGSGTLVTTTAEVEFEGDTLYSVTTIFGMKIETLVRAGETCVRSGGDTWQKVDIMTSGGAAAEGGILTEMLIPPYTGLERLGDATTEDGKDVFVLKAHLDETALQELSAASSGLFNTVDATSIESAEVEVWVDKSTYNLLRTRIDAVVMIQGTSVSETIVTTTDRQNLPARFPPDLPVSCSSLTS